MITRPAAPRHITRGGVRVAVGLIWFLDGALQLQPYMFGHGFARDIIAPAGDGQPEFVGGAVRWAAALIDAHPVLWNSGFAIVQLSIGLALLVRRTATAALAVSIAWALGVWYFGEGLGGLASGHTDMLLGAPGAVLLYAVIAAACLPRMVDAPHQGSAHRLKALLARGGTTSSRSDIPTAAWLPVAWAVLWVGSAVLRALPGQNTDRLLAAEISGNADGAPRWLAPLDRTIGRHVAGPGHVSVVVLVVLEAAVGLLALVPGRVRTVACTAGIVVSAVFWVVGQSFGELYSGQATDPNAAPLVALFAVAVLGAAARPVRRGRPVAAPRDAAASTTAVTDLARDEQRVP